MDLITCVQTEGADVLFFTAISLASFAPLGPSRSYICSFARQASCFLQ